MAQAVERSPSGGRNVMWSSAERVLQTALTLVTSPLIVGWFGERTYGLLAIGLTTIGVLGFADLGLTAAATRELAVADGQRDDAAARGIFATVLSVYIVLAAAVALALGLAAPLLVDRVFSLPADQRADGLFVLRMAAFGLGLNLLVAPWQAVLRATQRFDRMTQVSILTTGYATAGLLIFAHAHNLRAAVVWQLGSTVLQWLAYAATARRLRPGWLALPGFERRWLGPLAAFAIYQLLTQFMGSLTMHADRLLVAAYLTTADVTYYQVTSGLAQKIHVLIAAGASFVFPRVGELLGAQQHAAILQLYRQGTRLSLLVAGLLAAPTIAVAHLFLSVWMGQHFADAATRSLQYATLGWGLFCASVMPILTLLGLGRARAVTLVLSGISVLGVSLAAWWIPALGRDGAALSLVGSMGLSLVPLVVVHRMVGGDWATLGRSALRVGATVLLAGILARVGVPLLPARLPAVLLGMGLAALLAGGVWLAVPQLSGEDRAPVIALLVRVRQRLTAGSRS